MCQRIGAMKKIGYSFLLIIIITCQSCFEIVEQVFLKEDGTGTFLLTLNLSRSKTKLASIAKMKTINGHDVPTQQEIRAKLKDIEKTISKTQGISNCKTSIDFENYIATIGCNFTKVENLNAVVKNIVTIENGKSKYVDKSYAYDAAANVFYRLNKYSLRQDYNKMSNADKEIFATANYTSIYKFENQIATVSNAGANISASKKAIMLKQNVLDVIMEKKSIENKITLTK